MTRWVTEQRPGLKAAGGGANDDVLARLVKYVPAEILAPFTILFGVAASLTLDEPTRQWTAVALIGALLAATIVFLLTRAPQGRVRIAHLIVSPIAFVAWAYPISSSMLGDWFIPLAAFGLQAVVIILSIFIVPTEG